MTTTYENLTPPRLGRGWPCHLNTEPDLCGCDLLLVVSAPIGWARDHAQLNPEGEGLDCQDHPRWGVIRTKIERWAESHGLTLDHPVVAPDGLCGAWLREHDCGAHADCWGCSRRRGCWHENPWSFHRAGIRIPLAPVDGAE